MCILCYLLNFNSKYCVLFLLAIYVQIILNLSFEEMKKSERKKNRRDLGDMNRKPKAVMSKMSLSRQAGQPRYVARYRARSDDITKWESCLSSFSLRSKFESYYSLGYVNRSNFAEIKDKLNIVSQNTKEFHMSLCSFY